MPSTPLAHMGGLWGSGLAEVSDDPGVLDGSGRWAVAIPYSGRPVLARFLEWSDAPAAGRCGALDGTDA